MYRITPNFHLFKRRLEQCARQARRRIERDQHMSGRRTFPVEQKFDVSTFKPKAQHLSRLDSDSFARLPFRSDDFQINQAPIGVPTVELADRPKLLSD
jgi:hypothetical protein